VCPVGHYCEEGSIAPTQCPPGTASNARGLHAESECAACPGGFICPESGMCAECLPGYVCLGETRSATPSDRWLDRGYECPAGSYCPSGS
ncbi:hypothetical protein AURANDRAFT_16886, partial [Aureococcus anophagefferens]